MKMAKLLFFLKKEKLAIYITQFKTKKGNLQVQKRGGKSNAPPGTAAGDRTQASELGLGQRAGPGGHPGPGELQAQRVRSAGPKLGQPRAPPLPPHGK